MYNSRKYDWEVRDDAETLRKYQEIKSNPERFKKAQACIEDSVRDSVAVLQDKPINNYVPARFSNKATIKKL